MATLDSPPEFREVVRRGTAEVATARGAHESVRGSARPVAAPERLLGGRWTEVGERAGGVAPARNAGKVFSPLRRRLDAARHNPITLQRAHWSATAAITVYPSHVAAAPDVASYVRATER